MTSIPVIASTSTWDNCCTGELETKVQTLLEGKKEKRKGKGKKKLKQTKGKKKVKRQESRNHKNGEGREMEKGN